MAIKSDRIFIVGASGQGKSHFTLWLIEERYVFNRRARFILCDYTGEYAGLALHPNVTLIRITNDLIGKIYWEKTIDKYRKIVVEFEVGIGPDEINDEIARIAYACMNVGRVMFILDEAPNIIPISSPFLSKGKLAEHRNAIRYLCTQGRKKKVGYVIISQRVEMIDKTPLTQATELFIFRMHAPQDLEAVAPYVPNSDIIRDLPNYHCYHYKIDGTQEILEPGRPSVPHYG